MKHLVAVVLASVILLLTQSAGAAVAEARILECESAVVGQVCAE